MIRAGLEERLDKLQACWERTEKERDMVRVQCQGLQVQCEGLRGDREKWVKSGRGVVRLVAEMGGVQERFIGDVERRVEEVLTRLEGLDRILRGVCQRYR